MLSRRSLLQLVVGTSAFLLVSGFKACWSETQINRVLAALRALPPFVRAFGLASGTQEKILSGVSTISASFQIFADNPTRGNLRNTLEVINKLLEDGVFDTQNPTTTARIKAALGLVVFVIETINPPAPPAGTPAALQDNRAKVTVSDEQKKLIEPKIDELEEMLGIK